MTSLTECLHCECGEPCAPGRKTCPDCGCVDCGKSPGKHTTRAGEPLCDDCSEDELYCPRCDGSGEGMWDGARCDTCGGSGVAGTRGVFEEEINEDDARERLTRKGWTME